MMEHLDHCIASLNAFGWTQNVIEQLTNYIVVQRLADQVPMLIRYFILKESGRILCSKMLGLLNSDDLDEMLTEESEIGRRRSALLSRVERLGLANDKISSL